MNDKELTARTANIVRKTPSTAEDMMALATAAAVLIGRRARETGMPLTAGLELVMTVMGEYAVRGYEGKFDA